MQFKDYYAILGVPKTASQAEIKSAFRKLARQYHPDVVNPSEKAEAEKRFKEINEAYDVLKDEQKRAADELEAKILELGKDSVIAFIAETVGGATSGAITPAPGYFKRIREICDKYGVLLILDEVMCGMGRTGTLHACEQEGVSPDIMAIAKGLGGGYQPIGAVLLGQRLQAGVDVRQCIRAIDTGLASAEQIQIRAMQDQYAMGHMPALRYERARFLRKTRRIVHQL